MVAFAHSKRGHMHRIAGAWILATLLSSAGVAGDGEAPQPQHEGERKEARQSNKLQLYSYETEYLTLIYYTKEHEYLVPHLVRCFENSLAFHRELFDYTPSEKIVMLIHDFGDHGHGGTSTVPWNYITIGIEPFDYVYETMPANERMNWLMHHELMHVVATDKGAGKDNAARKFFRGKVAPDDDQPLSMYYSWLTSPRWYSPRWYHEGIAVFLETWMAGGMGRVLGGYDEMVFRAMVEEDRHFYDIVGLESEGTTIDFQVGQNSYLYGTRFITWLGLQYGPEKLVQWFDRSPDGARYFSKQFRQVYGVRLKDEWRRWVEWEEQWQADNLALVRAYPVTPDRRLTDQILGSVSRPFYDAERNRLLVAANYPGSGAHIAAIDLETGKSRKLTDVIGPALYYVSSLAWDPGSRQLFYTTDNSRGWRDLNVVDVDTRKSRRLLKDYRGGNLVLNPVDQALWSVQHHNGLSSIVRIPPPYDAWQTLLTLDYGRDVFDLDISPDGQQLSAGLIEVDGSQRLVVMDIERLQRGDGSYDVLYEFENNSPENFVFSTDGRYVYGSSYYTGVSNLFRYDLQTEELQALTNAEIGYFRPLPLDDDRMLAFRYTAEGFVPVELPIEPIEDVNAVQYLGQQIVKEHPMVLEWNAGSPLRIDLDRVRTFHGEYQSGKKIRLASIYPVVEGYKDTFALGARLNFADYIALNSLDVTVAYSPTSDRVGSDEQFHLKAEYGRFPWTVKAGHNHTDFYDLFGPLETSRKGSYLGFDYENFIVNERPKTLTYRFALAGFAGLDTLPRFQNVAAPSDNLVTGAAGLSYANFRRTIGAVGVERGVGWNFRLVSNYALDDIATRVNFDVDYGILTPLDHSSIWLRGSEAGRCSESSTRRC